MNLMDAGAYISMAADVVPLLQLNTNFPSIYLQKILD